MFANQYLAITNIINQEKVGILQLRGVLAKRTTVSTHTKKAKEGATQKTSLLPQPFVAFPTTNNR